MTAHAAPPAAADGALPLNWLGVVPFVVFALLFLILPTMNIVLGAFRNAGRRASRWPTSRGLFTPSILAAYWISIKISARLGAPRLPDRLCHGRGGHRSAGCRAGSARRC